MSAWIIEAAIAVHRDLGSGFLESVYHRALMVALANRRIPFDFEKEIRIEFEKIDVGSHKLDLVVDHQVVVELKAIKALEDVYYAQVRSYLKASRLKVGLLMNFNTMPLTIRRIVLSADGTVASASEHS